MMKFIDILNLGFDFQVLIIYFYTYLGMHTTSYEKQIGFR